jgi:hypothetical protein
MENSHNNRHGHYSDSSETEPTSKRMLSILDGVAELERSRHRRAPA